MSGTRKREADVGGRLEEAAQEGAQTPAGAAPDQRKPPEATSRTLPTLPTQARPAAVGLADKVVLIYGPPKIGKSTLASEAGRVLFFEMEPGLSGLEILTTEHITDWATFCAWVNAAVADGGKSYDWFCIDTCDLLAERCTQHTNAKLGILHESDLDYGKGWSVAKKELKRWVNKLASVPNTGLILISHAETKEIKTRSAAYDKTVPTLNKGGREVFVDMADLVLFADLEGEGEEERHVLRTKPSRYFEAGDRGGRLPEVVEWPPGRGWRNLAEAYANNNKEG